MSFDDAVAAMEQAVAADEAEGQQEYSDFLAQSAQQVTHQAPESSAPQGESAQPSAAPQVPQPVVHVDPTQQPAPAVDTDPSFMEGSAINPDELPEELQPLVKQLQGAFTRKTQQLALERQQYGQLGSPEELQQAAQLYQQIRDPRNWQQVHRELTTLMEQNGMAPVAPQQQPPIGQQPQPAFGQAPPAQAPGMVDPAVLAELAEYPELAPVANAMMTQQQMLQQMQQRMDGMQQSFAQQQEAAQQEARQMAMLGEFQRQEAILRSNGLNDSDMSHVYELGHAYGGDLIAAANAYEAMKTQVLSDYLSRKTVAAQDPAAAIHGGSTSVTPPGTPKTLSDATDIAIETLRAQGLDTFDW